MKLKAGVKLFDIKPQIVLAMIVVEGVYQSFNVEFVVTSVNDGKHSDGSWHYKGCAFDCRTKQASLDGKEQALRDEIKAALGPDFDVVLEAVGTDNEHVHIEYDPKG